jgi:hypothetical protein
VKRSNSARCGLPDATDSSPNGASTLLSSMSALMAVLNLK